MHYLLMIYAQEKAWNDLPESVVRERITAYGAFTEAVKKAGVLVGSNRLRDTDTATTIRIANGKTTVQDGPFAETKEQLGGYYLIDVPDLDAALSWAARCPGAADGAVEVRPIWPMS